MPGVSKITHKFDSMVCFPNCKINIGLYITSKRPDGYHNLETLFVPVPLTDILEVVRAPETSLTLTGIPVQGNATDNLVMRAFQLLQQDYPNEVGPAATYLHKVIPSGAGLGGGSSDGAFMLQTLSSLFHLELTQEQLAAYGLRLGSDCPFFIYNRPIFASGRGEVFEDVALSLSGYAIQLLCPHVHVSTSEAFKMIRPQPAAYNLREIAALPIENWKDHIANNFEGPVFARHPQLAGFKDMLYASGALYASMSGSGSALYGIYRKGHRPELLLPTGVDSYYMDI